MNCDTSILVEGLSKRYRLGQQVGYKTLRESLMRAVSAPFHKIPVMDHDLNYIWALKDVSFEVKQGEAVGIIGRNGSGKSTLLKVLSCITSPTEGRVETRGRVGSLLEVGTGFHPELTGRENVYLNGAIIGMKKSEIDLRFKAIIEFSEIEKFLDTPVKRYSSGMYVRLAFAVAIHLEPDILIVDEVLAVGDAAFQRKCLGRMESKAEQGRTVLLVSHNMSAIRQLCTRSLWIDSGKVVLTGPSDGVIDSYLKSASGEPEVTKYIFPDNPEKDVQLLSSSLLNKEGSETQLFECDGPIIIDLVCRVHRKVPGLEGKLFIYRDEGTIVMVSESCDVVPDPTKDLPRGTYSFRISLPARTISPGNYKIYLALSSGVGGVDYQIDNPGVIGSFHLKDVSTLRGNARLGFFSTIIPWVVTPL